MSHAGTPKAVVFDLAGVLLASGGSIPDLAAELDVAVDELAAAYWSGRDGYDRGGSSTAYWYQVAAGLGRSVGPADVHRLDAIDAARWSSLAPGPRDLVADLARGAVPLAVLSNAPASLAAAARSAPWTSAFSILLFSCDVGLLKPEPAIYRTLEERLGLAGPDIAFLDDRQANVDAARRRGWRATRWTGLAAAQTELASWGVRAG